MTPNRGEATGIRRLPQLVCPELEYFAFKSQWENQWESGKFSGKVGNSVGNLEIQWENGKMT